MHQLPAPNFASSKSNRVVSRARFSPIVEVPRGITVQPGIVDPAPGSGRVPKRAVAPGLARHGAEPMIKNGELLRELT